MLKRWLVFIIVQSLLLAVIAGVIYHHRDKVQLIKTPPASLAQWYKPQNKRQVWLHNMFKLRREMQAVQYYAQLGDQERLDKWLTNLNNHYLEIEKMVPSWGKKLNLEIIAALQQSAANKSFAQIPDQLEQLRENCQSCHNDYRSITATTYRAPDFSTLTVSDNVDLGDHMKRLSEQVNLIKIAATDGFNDVALSSLVDLKNSMAELGDTCVSCHKDGSKEFPNAEMSSTLVKLEDALQSGTLKETGKELGTLAVLACATCHATHRLSYDNQQTFANKRPLSELIKH